MIGNVLEALLRRCQSLSQPTKISGMLEIQPTVRWPVHCTGNDTQWDSPSLKWAMRLNIGPKTGRKPDSVRPALLILHTENVGVTLWACVITSQCGMTHWHCDQLLEQLPILIFSFYVHTRYGASVGTLICSVPGWLSGIFDILRVDWNRKVVERY